MDKFLDLLGKSVIVSGLIALALVGTSCYLFATGQPVPDLLAALVTSVLGYFLGSKAESAINRMRAV